MGNKLAKRIAENQRDMFFAGMETGEQFTADCFAIAMKKAKISRRQIAEIAEDALAILEEYEAMFAVKKNPEADVMQEHFEAALKDAYLDKYSPRQERYKYISEAKY